MKEKEMVEAMVAGQLKITHALCEALDELYLTALDANSPDLPWLRSVLSALKDARAATERAWGAIP